MYTRFISLLFIFMLSTLTSAQYVEKQTYENAETLKRKLNDYNKMKRVGTVFLFTGGSLTISGVALIAHAYSVDNHDLPYGVIGAGALGVGLPFLTSGTILAIIGSKKSAEYSKKLAGISLGYFSQHTTPTLRISLKL